MIDAHDVAKLIQAGLPDATVRVEDPLNDKTHLRAVVVSPSFTGKSRVAQHRLVYAALGNAFSGPLHALQLTTLSPDEHKE